MGFRKSHIIVSSFVTMALALSASAALPAGAVSPSSTKPKVAMQCFHPGFKHFGFASLKDCLKFVAMNGHDHGHGYGYGGKGHGEGGDINIENTVGDVFSHIGHITNSVINVTFNFVTNIFHH